MLYFIGIVPPPQIHSTIAGIQNQYGNNRIEPHITLRHPFTPVDEEEWLSKASEVISGFIPFTIQLPGTGNFGSRVLYISVKSEQLNNLYHGLIPALSPFEPEEKKRGEEFHPHLTLGRTWCGFSKEDFAAMRKLADEYLKKEPVLFEVNFVRIYYKPDPKKGYQMFKDVGLVPHPNPPSKGVHWDRKGGLS